MSYSTSLAGFDTCYHILIILADIRQLRSIQSISERERPAQRMCFWTSGRRSCDWPAAFGSAEVVRYVHLPAHEAVPWSSHSGAAVIGVDVDTVPYT